MTVVPEDLPDGYPADYEADVVLADGGTVHVRPIRPDDGGRIAALHHRLSPETVYLRFFTPLPSLSPAMLERFVHVDYTDRLALVAELGPDILAVARYDRLPGQDAAEVAFVVDDAHQGRGIGILLLEHLAAAAAERGIRRFVAETLPTNDKMLSVFHAAGFGEERHFAEGVVQVSFPIEPTDSSVAAMHAREQRAAARSIQRLLRPGTIAVIGAGREASEIGHSVFVNLLASGFSGAVYPVNPAAHAVASVRSYASILDIPDHIDLAVIVVPATAVPHVIDECGQKHVGALVVVSAGFADAGADGAAAERRLVSQARGLGMRLVGPNSMGVINTSPATSMNATFAPMPPHGRIGFLSQSGALGAAILDAMARQGLGVSSFVATGNKADISGNDLLQYWDDDPDTDVVVLYLESFGNPRTFARVARRVSRAKPVLAVKSGRAAARTGGDAAVDALFRHTGVIRVETLEELFDLAQALCTQPLPGGRRVGIVGNAGGPGLVAADACEGAGLVVARLSELPLSAAGEDYDRELGSVLGADDVDAAIAFYVPPLPGRAAEVASAIAERAAASGKPVLANFLASGGVPGALRSGRKSIPTYDYPESAALALARMAGYAEWRRRPQGHQPDLPGVDRAAATRLVAGHDGWLADQVAQAVLAAYRIPFAAQADSGGVLTVVAVEQHPESGPLVAFRLGGPALELMGDRGSSILPLTDLDAAELVRSLKGSPLLFGYGGGRPVDVAALEDLLLRVSQLVDDVPEIAEVVLDPVSVGPAGAAALAVSMRVAPWHARPDQRTRRLR
jgi:acyl-CoA synthetase (NDP forming)/GNAT superfamily N-acetyltransferase